MITGIGKDLFELRGGGCRDNSTCYAKSSVRYKLERLTERSINLVLQGRLILAHGAELLVILDWLLCVPIANVDSKLC